MFIFTATGKRANPYVRYIDAQGTQYTCIPMELLEEIADPVPPVDFSDDLYYRNEQDDAPYVTWTRKPQPQIAATFIARVKRKRDDLTLNGGCLVTGKWFHSDTHSKVQQLALVIAGANLPQGIMWKTMDGTFIAMTPTLASQIYAAQMAQEQGIFAHAETLKAALLASPTPETVDIVTGWPATYVEAV